MIKTWDRQQNLSIKDSKLEDQHNGFQNVKMWPSSSRAHSLEEGNEDTIA